MRQVGGDPATIAEDFGVRTFLHIDLCSRVCVCVCVCVHVCVCVCVRITTG